MKNAIVRTENAITKIGDSSADYLERVPDTIKAKISITGNTMNQIQSRIGLLEKEAISLKAKIGKNPEIAKLKSVKKDLKLLTKALTDYTNKYNGMWEIALVDVPGETLNDKYQALQVNSLEAHNG